MMSGLPRCVKSPPAMQETQGMWVQLLGQEDPLQEGTGTLSRILAWRIPWTAEPSNCIPWGCKESYTTEATEHAND